MISIGTLAYNTYTGELLHCIAGLNNLYSNIYKIFICLYNKSLSNPTSLLTLFFLMHHFVYKCMVGLKMCGESYLKMYTDQNSICADVIRDYWRKKFPA